MIYREGSEIVNEAARSQLRHAVPLVTYAVLAAASFGSFAMALRDRDASKLELALEGFSSAASLSLYFITKVRMRRAETQSTYDYFRKRF